MDLWWKHFMSMFGFHWISTGKLRHGVAEVGFKTTWEWMPCWRVEKFWLPVPGRCNVMSCFKFKDQYDCTRLECPNVSQRKGCEVIALKGRTVIHIEFSKRSKKYQCHLSRYIVDNDGHPPRSCSSSKTFENWDLGSRISGLQRSGWTRGSMWFYCKGAPKNSITRRNFANATLGEDYSASFDMEIGNPSNMKHDCPWPTSSNPRHMPADLKVARWPCSGSLNVRKANIYYLSEIDSSYSGAGYNWIQISALLQISSYNLGMSCYLPHDWNHTVDSVLPHLASPCVTERPGQPVLLALSNPSHPLVPGGCVSSDLVEEKLPFTHYDFMIMITLYANAIN